MHVILVIVGFISGKCKQPYQINTYAIIHKWCIIRRLQEKRGAYRAGSLKNGLWDLWRLGYSHKLNYFIAVNIVYLISLFLFNHDVQVIQCLQVSSSGAMMNLVKFCLKYLSHLHFRSSSRYLFHNISPCISVPKDPKGVLFFFTSRVSFTLRL